MVKKTERKGRKKYKRCKGEKNIKVKKEKKITKVWEKQKNIYMYMEKNE